MKDFLSVILLLYSFNAVIKINDNKKMTGISIHFRSSYEHSIFIWIIRKTNNDCPSTHPSLVIYTHMYGIVYIMYKREHKEDYILSIFASFLCQRSRSVCNK